MKVLALDTATRATTVALWDSAASESIEARDDPEPGERPRHTTKLMSLIVHVLERGACSWSDVDRIAVGVGPGTFTGLRIGVTTARALAAARQRELVGVSTLQALAAGAAREACATESDAILAVLDARRGEVFAAAWAPDDVGNPGVSRALLEPAAVAPPRLAERAAQIGQRRLEIGEGAVEFRAVLERSGTSVPDDSSTLHRVSAVFIARLAYRSDPGDGEDVRPEYLRAPDAELSLQAARRR
jgi:tRNA threonylcarbamoyladenosine biosynthesis protein TsaB